MRLADETIFTVGHEAITLRATLRAAIRLDRRHGGFQKIANAIAAGNLSVMGSVIRECSAARTDLADLLDCGGSLSIKVLVEHIAAPLINHVFDLAGIDPEAPSQPASGKPMSHAELHAKLFRIATGALGWTPEQAYEATPYEITEAYQGRQELLKALFGGGEAEAVDISDPSARRQLNSIGDFAA